MSRCTVGDIITPNFEYCTAFFHLGPIPAISASIPVICFDILLVFLSVAILVKHMRERREIRRRPNTYVLLIVRYHVIYFVINLATEIFMAVLWANLPTPVFSLLITFNDTAPFIIVPRLIISIWDTHANAKCIYVSTTFEDCACWTSPPRIEEHEMDPRAECHNQDEGKSEVA
ncbi:hypothetical protein DFH29DRAFT_942816 [Suillus ampliporus]|nr:hypothetical protein DFH29DRAFT_942816 [Suillus ampliporus]